MNRTIGLGALVLVGLVLVAVIEPPPRLTPAELVRGPRVVGARGTVTSLRVTIRQHVLDAVRGEAGWRLPTGPADAATAEALDALVTVLLGLRAIDAFRPKDGDAYGLDPAQGRVEIGLGDGRTRTLHLGAVTAGGGAVYARREGHPRVFIVGVYLISALERVLGARDAAAKTSGV